ncbi:MAG TPA: LLM class flavin-dependent oxidoreductase [Dehalococcoidia bacterium]|nr:LLM class flavin-dependent oxidoreductase [Dehalococcoidia bacterium]
MASAAPRFGLTLPNRGVIIGATTVPEMLKLAQRAEATGWDSVWVGDSIFAKPRLDAIALLGALAACTQRVRLGPACFASTPLRDALVLAYQWCSLDFMSNGRTIFVACQGQPAAGGGDFTEEFRAFRIDPASRMRRMEEFVEILRLVSSREHASYHGAHYEFDDLTVLPRPAQQPLPIWLVSNPDLKKRRNVEAGFGRVARLGDGWMVTAKTPEEVKQSLALIRGFAKEQGRELGPDFEVCVYYNFNVNEDRDAALDESKRFLDSYYSVDYHPAFLERWVAAGSPQRCIEEIRAFVDAGATTITLRPTGYDQERQFQRVSEEVLPAFA